MPTMVSHEQTVIISKNQSVIYKDKCGQALLICMVLTANKEYEAVSPLALLDCCGVCDPLYPLSLVLIVLRWAARHT